MPDTFPTHRPARTVLEQLIWERRQTLEEFVEYAETFAREHKEPGTLGVRHLQRLIAGKRSDGRPLGPVRPATARLLEHIFGTRVEELLSDPQEQGTNYPNSELTDRLNTSTQVDATVIDLLYEQLNLTRRLDRQLGAIVAHDEVKTKIDQVDQLLTHSLIPGIRARLAALLSELYTLAGWQSLDLKKTKQSWLYYEQARRAASESNSKTFQVYTDAQQALVLLDINRSADAVQLLSNARERASNSSPAIILSWLAAAHAEVLAANMQCKESLNAFDEAASSLPTSITCFDGPYLALDAVHLDRWRGHTLTRLGSKEAVPTLMSSLDRLDSTFTRAEAALRVDLAVALNTINEKDEAQRHARHAARLAQAISSARQYDRIQPLLEKPATHYPRK